MAIEVHEDKNGYLVYTNTRTGKKARAWGDDVAAIAFVCQDWHGGQKSACYAMMSGDYSYENLDDTLTELREALEDAEDDSISEDDYLDLATAVEDLDGIVGRTAAIADEE